MLLRARHLAALAALGAVAAGVLGACAPGGDGSSGSLGADVYSRNCRSCHGGDGGGGFGMKLSDGRAAARYPNDEDLMAVVRDGRGSMPSWGTKLTEEEIRAVAEYVRTL